MLMLALAPARATMTAEQAGITNFILDNGMEVVVIPDHRAPVVTHMVWYKIGSADEPPGKSGIAHFFEHLMFKGTTNRKPGEFDAIVSQLGGSQNAFTTDDYTAFYETVAPDSLQLMMSLEADRMRNLVLTDAVIGPERDVVLSERRQRVESNPEALLSEEVQATLYQNQPDRIPTIGWMHEMEKLNRIDATAFYDLYYRPNNAVLIVAGDVDPKAVRKMADETYGKVARGPDLPPRNRPTEPEQNTSRTVTLSDARVSIPSFSINWIAPSYNTAKDGEAEALDLLSEILGGGNRSRLYQDLVVKQDLASQAGAFYQGSTLDGTSFGVYASPDNPEDLAKLEKAVRDEVARIAKSGVNDSELQSAKNRYVRAMIFARDSQSDMANIYGQALTTGSTVQDVLNWPDRIKAVTAAQVQAVAAKYLKANVSVTGYLLPAEETAQ